MIKLAASAHATTAARLRTGLALLAAALPAGRNWAHGAELDWHVAP